jgi:uncharacterized protein YhdP
VIVKVNWKDTLIPQVHALNGTVQFDLMKGELSSHFSPFLSVIKLITLDMGNIFGSNYSFSRFFGEVTFQGESLKIKQAKLKLNPATLNFHGNYSITKREMDLFLEVTPKITNSIVGIALTPVFWILSIFEFKKSWINRIFNHTYKVVGSPEDMKVEFHKMGTQAEDKKE